MTTLTQDLINLLDLKQIDRFIFQGHCSTVFGSHLFGGQLLAQALIAAARTTDRPAHSLHAYFLRPGVTDTPILYHVSSLHDGNSFCRRQVKAFQNGKNIFIALLSFTHPEEGVEFQSAKPNHPKREELTAEQTYKNILLDQRKNHTHEFLAHPFQLDIYPTQFLIQNEALKKSFSYAEYFKTYETIPEEVDNDVIHQAIAAYYSDYNLLSISLLVHGFSSISNNLISASLDHAIYFHHPFRVDEWSLYDLKSPITSQSRGSNYGQIWQNDKLVCSTVQESLMRKY